VRDLGQDVAHEVDLASLPGGAQPLLAHRGLGSRRERQRSPARSFSCLWL
jgi:hypothetical protein